MASDYFLLIPKTKLPIFLEICNELLLIEMDSVKYSIHKYIRIALNIYICS